jgi:hypothetical protein
MAIKDFTMIPEPWVGQIPYNEITNSFHTWDGLQWVAVDISAREKVFESPTESELEQHPTLKQAWEEFLIVKKLIGV